MKKLKTKIDIANSKNIETVMKWVEASNEHNPEKIVAQLHPDYEFEFSNSSRTGKEHVYEDRKEFLEAFPDLNYKVEH